MFSLTELHVIHGNVKVKGSGVIEIPIKQVGDLLDWKLEKVFQNEVLIFGKPPIKLFPDGGPLVVVVVNGVIGAEFSWHAERYILHIWPKES